jgi:hypothetical protein
MALTRAFTKSSLLDELPRTKILTSRAVGGDVRAAPADDRREQYGISRRVAIIDVVC